MKRSLALALGLLLALTALGVAWAAWGATLYVKTTVTAADHLEVIIVDVNDGGDAKVTAVLSGDSMTLTIGVTDAMPGEQHVVTFKFQNNSDYGVVVERVGNADYNDNGISIACDLELNNSESVASGAKSGDITITVDTASAMEPEATSGEYTFTFDAVIN